MSPLKKSFTSTEYCALCRGRFPSTRLEGLDAWQSEFRAALCLVAENEQSLEITEVANLPDIEHDVDVDISLAEPPRIETITICRSSSSVNVESPYYGPAFCFHDWCYSILIWKLGCHPPKSIIYKLVRTIIPKSSTWQNICEAGYQLDPVGTLQTLIAHADRPPYNPQLLLMSRLPVEVRVRIWEYVGLGTAYSAFILVTGETSRLARYVESRQTYDLALERGCHLLAKTIMVFGTEYIQHLGYDKDLKVTTRVLGDVIGLQFVASVGGICAIKLLGVDWETSWLGKVLGIGHFWYGTIRDPIPYLRCIYNDLNCVDTRTLGLHSTSLVLWDQLNVPSSLVDPDVALFDFERDIMGSSRSPITTCQRRFFRYLSLCSDDEYIKGLTLYQIGNGIVGLEAHFTQTSQLSGCRSDCALYFPLCPNERIAYAWLRILNFDSLAWAAPALVVQTTQGRLYSFGSYIRPDLVIEKYYKWILLKKMGCVTGLYYENRPSYGKIMRLGVTGDGVPLKTAPLTPQYRVCRIPPIGSIGAGLFLSTAILSGLDKVDLCRVSNRCIGMLIHYISGLTVVLGQWRTAGGLQYSCIYKSDNRTSPTSITNIYFRITRSGRHTIVTDVSFLEDYSGVVIPNSEYQVYREGECIAWWFSQFYDVVVPWTGLTQDIPGECKMSQKRFSSS